MPKPNLKEIEWAISELEQEESSFPVYAKLANLYTVRNEMMGISSRQPQAAAYSKEAAPASKPPAPYGDSDFLQAVGKIPAADAWAVMDELMETLQAVNPRVYASIMRKLHML